MDRLIWTAMSGMTESVTRQGVIANNMANAQTIGFRAETIFSTPVTLKGPSLEARAMSEGAMRGANMRAGSVIQTGRPLDIAIAGDAMLTLQAEDGTEAYSRRGDLSVSTTGVLENGDGRPVIGSGGPITVPPGGSVTIAPDGTVMLINTETPGLPPQAIDRIKLVNPNGTRIEKGLDGLFRAPAGGVLPTDEDARVQNASLEQSNVDPSEVMVEMVSAQRLFDIRTKMISTAREIDERGASLMKLT